MAVNRAIPSGPSSAERLVCRDVVLDARAPRLSVAIPTGFTQMLQEAPDLAMDWRLATRRIFTTYLGRGYRVVAFSLEPSARQGAYLLVKSS